MVAEPMEPRAPAGSWSMEMSPQSPDVGPAYVAEASARLAKLRQATDRLAQGAVRDFLKQDLQAALATTLQPGAERWLSVAQTAAAAQLAEAAHSGFSDAWHEHRATELARRLEGTNLRGSQVASTAAALSVPEVESAEDLQARLRCHAQTAKLNMLRTRLREQELENEREESQNKRLRVEAEGLYSKLDSLTCSMMAPFLRGSDGGS